MSPHFTPFNIITEKSHIAAAMDMEPGESPAAACAAAGERLSSEPFADSKCTPCLLPGEHTHDFGDYEISYCVHGVPIRDAELILFAVHGAGQTKETFLQLFHWLGKHNLCLIAPDLREHGKSVTKCGLPTLQLRVLANDLHRFVTVALKAAGLHQDSNAPRWGFLGHSIGGCVVVAALRTLQDAGRQEGQILTGEVVWQPRLPEAVVLLDCATQSATESLAGLSQYLQSERPTQFADLEEAVKWHIQKGIYWSSFIAAKSVAAMLAPSEDGEALQWRTNLGAFETDWSTWAGNVSTAFVSLPACVKKQVVVSSSDILDEPLLKAQMLGSIAVNVVQAGHQLHENASDKVAMCIIKMWQKTGVLLPKLLPLAASQQPGTEVTGAAAIGTEAGSTVEV